MTIEFHTLTPEQLEYRKSEAERFKFYLHKYGTTAAQFARFTDTSPNTVYSWIRKTNPNSAPRWAWRFLELIAKVPEAREYAYEKWVAHEKITPRARDDR